jgi:hypothetical protein
MRPVVAIAILAALPFSVALADVYRSVDAQGHVLYSDTPTPGAQLVRVTNSQSLYSSPMPASSSAAKPATSPPQKIDPSADASASARESAAKTVHTEVAQNRAEQCKKAQDYYNQIVAARRVYSGEANANGDRQYLTDAEADKARVDAKLQMDDLCQSQ